MKSPIISVTEIRNNQSVQILDSAVLINGVPAEMAKVSALLTKPLIVKLYNEAVTQIGAIPLNHLKNMKFDALVLESKRLIEIRATLQALRDLNAEGSTSWTGSKGLEEKTREHLHAVFRRIFQGLSYKAIEAFTAPQRAVLELVSCRYIGSMVDSYHFNELFEASKDDNSKAEKLAKDFASFDYSPYITNTNAEFIKEAVTAIFAKHCERVDTFRKFRDIAGNDVVNWGAHKFHAQGKKHNLDYDYTIRRWFDDVTASKLASGIKLVAKKTTSVQKIKEKYSKGEPLTQEEYVTLFKLEGENSAFRFILNHMDPTTAVSLLSLNTKNVTSKLIRVRSYGREDSPAQPLPALKAIVRVVSRSKNVDAFQKLISYFESKSTSFVNWDLLINHAGHYSTSEFLKWADADRRELPAIELPDAFYSQVLTNIPADKQLIVNEAITHSFIKNMTLTERQNFLVSYRNVPLVMARLNLNSNFEFARVKWELSANLFFDLAYQEVKNFFSVIGSDGESRLKEEYEDFIPVIIKNNDNVTALKALSASNHNLELFKILSFDEKLEVLRSNYHNYLDLKEVFTKSELKALAKVALSDSELSKRLESLPKCDLNDNIKDASGRVYVPLTHEIVVALSKEAVMKVLCCNGFIEDTKSNYGYGYLQISTKQKLYAKITRKDFDKIYNVSILQHKDLIALVDLMTDEEIQSACDRNREFFRLNHTKVPADYFTQFKDKEAFKRIVGDRRNSSNDAFGNAIEARLKG